MEKKVRIADKSYWIGYIDDRKVPFHRLVLQQGTTYNSYLLKTDMPTIIDTVDISFGKKYVDSLQEQINLEEIKYIVINHVEPDHSGALPLLAKKAKNAIIVTTELGKFNLINMYKLHEQKFLVVKDGDVLDIGGKTLKFIETPYLHTEETMITYAVEDKVLYPCDIFSSHIATEELFNDLAKEDVMHHFEVYYKLIMNPHRAYVRNMLEKIKDLDIEIIAPSHGYIIRKDTESFIELYNKMSLKEESNKKALILYSTISGNTKFIANILAEGLKERGIDPEIINARKGSDVQLIGEKIKNYDLIFFGSSTRYGDMVGDMETVLKELREMDLSDKWGIAFGSYGWSGESIEIISDYLKETNIKVIDSSYIIKTTGMTDVQVPIRVNYSPENHIKEKINRTAQVIGDILIG